MTTSTTAPILPGALPTPTGPTTHDQGADTAPCPIAVHSRTTLGSTLVLHLAGEIDHFTAAPLQALLASAAADGHTGLALDTSRVTFADSGFLAVLRWWTQDGRRLRLTTRSRTVQRLLDAAAAHGPSDALTRHTEPPGDTGHAPAGPRAHAPRRHHPARPGRPTAAAATS
ncbi:STAS domain-containing protein [Kitasatospora sp. NPDC056076]|uniref:STAS domain-containing protein n=1 Tax=Kitasatospora sp. NPDC056076 TaxID=3345703 RepID=UPI0035E119F6